MVGFPGMIKKFGCRQDGLATVEFALVLPFLMLMIIGSAGIFDYLQAKGRAQSAADTVADLISRSMEMDDDEFDDVFRAANLVLGGYADRMTVRAFVTAYVYDDDDEEWVVEWSEGYNRSSPHSVGDTRNKNAFPRNHSKDMVIFVNFKAKYSNDLFYLNRDGLWMEKKSVRLPRYVNAIAYND